MQTKKTKAIVLRKVLYKEKSLVLTLFSENQGLFSLFLRNSNKNQIALFNPFSEGEFHYSEKNSDRFFYVDSSIIDLHLCLRKKYESLDAAAKITKFILSTQLPGKNTPLLYKLFSIYLKKIPTVHEPMLLVISFYLKVYKHDGLIALSNQCSKCQNPSEGLFQGESFCKRDLPYNGIFFHESEWEILKKLLELKSFENLDLLNISESLEEKISKLSS